MYANAETLRLERVFTPSLVRYAVPLGRALFAGIFLLGGIKNFSWASIEAATRQGVPVAEILVPLSGLVALIGGLSVLLGYHARLGAAFLVFFLVPVTFTMHAFWTIDDPATRQLQQVEFFKNLALLGGALVMTYCGSGPFSLDERLARQAGLGRRTRAGATRNPRAQ
jgi:putative oxidoreductase